MTQPEPIGLSNQPYYVRERKSDWATPQESYRHDQALYSIGEYALFVLMWTLADYENGLITRCQRCFDQGGLASRTAKVYAQPTQNLCPECFGTTFTGGVRAKIVRPALFTDTDEANKTGAKGTTDPQRASVESTNDFRYRSGDYVFRIDGTRWQIDSPTRVQLRTGFSHPNQAQDSIGYVRGVASLEAESSVAYIIPPGPDQLLNILRDPARYPSYPV